MSNAFHLANLESIALCRSVKIPTINGEKEWGTYKIENLGIKSFEVAADNVQFAETGAKSLAPEKRGMAIRVSDIAVVFDEFTFGFEKKTFPKVRARTSLTGSCLSPAECDDCPARRSERVTRGLRSPQHSTPR